MGDAPPAEIIPQHVRFGGIPWRPTDPLLAVAVCAAFPLVVALRRHGLRSTSHLAETWALSAAGGEKAGGLRSADPESAVIDEDERTVAGLPWSSVAAPLSLFLGCQALVYVGAGALGPGLPLYMKALGLTGSATGIILAIPALAMLPLNVPCGRLADEWGRRPLMIAGLALIGLGDALAGGCAALTVVGPAAVMGALLLGRVLLGMGRAVAEAGDRAFLADLCARAPQVRGRVLAAQHAVAGAGLVIGPLIGSWATARLGPGAPFLIIAAAAGLGALLFGAFLPETLEGKRPSGPVESPDPAVAADTSDGLWPLLRRLIGDPSQRAVVATAAANGFGLVAKISVVPVLLAGPLYGASREQIAFTFSAVAFVGLLGAQVGGLLADRTDPPRVAAAAAFLCAAAFVAALWAPTTPVLIGCLMAWGGGVGMLGPALMAAAQRWAPPGAVGTALALPKTATDAAFLVGPVTLGAVSDIDPRGVLVLCAVTSALSGGLLLSRPTPPPLMPQEG